MVKLLSVFGILFLFGCDNRTCDVDEIMLDSKIQMIIELIRDNNQRLDNVGLVTYASTLHYLDLIRAQLAYDLVLVDSIFDNNSSNTIHSFREALDYFEGNDSVRYKAVEETIIEMYRSDGLSEHIIINIRNGLKKEYSLLLTKYYNSPAFSKTLFKSYRIDFSHFLLSAVLNRTRGIRTGSNYAFYPKIDHGDMVIKNSQLSEVKLGIGVTPINLDFDNDIVSISVDGKKFLFDSTLTDKTVLLENKKSIGDTIELILRIKNPLTGEVFKTKNQYLVK